MKRSKVIQTYLLSGLGVVIVAAALIGANIVAYTYNATGDFTEEELFTLSPGTRNILSELPGPVTVRFYYTRGLEDDPELVPLSNFAKHVQDLLEEYADASDGKMSLEIYDPSPDTDAEDAALTDGMQPRDLASGERFFLGITAQYIDPQTAEVRTQRIAAIKPEQESRLEHDLTRLIFDITRGVKPKVGVISSLTVFGRNEADPLSMLGNQKAWGIIHELNRDFELVNLGRRCTEIPDDVEAVVVIHPRGLPDATFYAIDQFVLNGGNLIAFVDPVCTIESQKNPAAAVRVIPPGQSSMDRLFQAWGVQYSQENVVVDDSRKVIKGEDHHIAVVGLTKDDMNPDDVTTADLSIIWLSYAGCFQGPPAGDLIMTPLLSSTENSQLMDSKRFIMGVSPKIIYQDFNHDENQYDFAVRLSGKFPAAFPDGPPPLPGPEQLPDFMKPQTNITPDQARGPDMSGDGVAKPPKDDDATMEMDGDGDNGDVPMPDEDGADGELDFDNLDIDDLGEAPNMLEMEREANHISNAVAPANVILVADVDMLDNDFWIRRPPTGSGESPKLISHNAVFLLNAVEQLTGNADLISIRSKGIDRRPFTHVEEKKRAARDKWREKEAELVVKLQQIQAEIGEIRQVENELIITEEQQRQLEEFLEVRNEIQRQYREVKKDQRREIDRIENNLKWLNIAAIPFLIIHFSLILIVLRGGREQNR